MNKLIEALKAMFAGDPSRLQRALAAAEKVNDPEKVTAADIAAQLQSEDSRKEAESSRQVLCCGVKHFGVSRESGELTDLALITGGREATGHGIYIDDRTLQTAVESVSRRGGVLKAQIKHPTLSQWWEGEDRLMEVPGWFSDIQIRDGKLVAGALHFYDSFKDQQPEAYARLLEMAEKTPALLGLSIEAYGYSVFVAADGKEFTRKPEDLDLKYDGMPAFRITDLTAAAFVSEPAANDGLFASAMRRLGKRDNHNAVEALLSAIAAYQESNTPETEETMKKLIEALKAMFKDDQARLARALVLAANAADPDKTTAEEISATLAREDDQAELATLREKAAEADKLKQEREDLQNKLKGLQASGSQSEVNTGGTQSTGLNVNGATARVVSHMQAAGNMPRNFAITGIDDLWVPEVWIPTVAETSPVRTEFLGSGVIVTNPALNTAASQGGSAVEVPFFREPDQADEPQSEAGPTLHGLTDGRMVAAKLNRVNTLGATALAAGLSGTDPVGYAVSAIRRLRDRNRLRTLIAILRGLFGTDAGSAYAALRLDAFSEDGATPLVTNLFDSDMFFAGAGKLGENKYMLERGAILIHPDIETAMSMQDDITLEKPSAGDFLVRMYKKTIPVYTSSLLVRAGTTSGKVYDSYIFAPGTVGVGDRPQTNRVGDIASLVMKEDEHTNDQTIYDRTSGFIHPNGAKWVGTAANAKGGPTNTELANKANWELGFAHPENVGITCVRTNG